MTGQAIVDLINVELDRVGGSGAFEDSDLLGFVNEGYNDFCRETEALETSQVSVQATYQSLVNLPADFLDSRQFRWSYQRQLFPKTTRELDEDQRGWFFDVGVPEQVVFYNFGVLRLNPIPSTAGTVTHRYAYIPDEIQLTTEPVVQAVFHHAFVDFGASAAFMIFREYEEASLSWLKYVEKRRDAKRISRQYQRGPGVFLTQRPVTTFNYKNWMIRRGGP